MKNVAVWIVVLLVILVAVGEAKSKEGAEVSFSYMDTERTYFLFEPEGLGESPPVLVLLHGSGRRGDSLVKPWKKLAEEEKILLVAPNSADPMVWSPYDDPAPFIRVALNHVSKTRSFDRNRIYLFGHSGGAVWALQLGMLASKEIAAVAVHAGLIPEEAFAVIDQAKRKTPVLIQVGDRDRFFPVDAVQVTVDYLKGAGFDPQLTIIPKHDHDYYSKAKKINLVAWEFLKKQTLSGE